MSETIIIESNRQIAYKQELSALLNSNENNANLNLPNNKWSTRLENGVAVNVGDTIQVEAIMVNTRGSPEETIEFSGKGALISSTDRQDNKVLMKFQSYITNRQQFNCNLPLRDSEIMKVDGFAPDYGYVALDSFNNFRRIHPYRGIEGMSSTVANPPVFTEVLGDGVFSNPPIPLDTANPERMYLGIDNFIGYGNILVTPEKSNAWDYKTHEIPLEVDTGFNTPSKIGETLTAQLHQRQGFPVNWDEEDVKPTVVSLNTANQFVIRPNACVTDQSFRTVSTSTGDIFLARQQNKWHSKIAGEGGTVAEGAGYIEEEGRDVFHKNLLCGNPEEYRNVWGWIAGRINSANSAALTIANYETKGLYTGDLPHNGATVPVGKYGLNTVLIDGHNYTTNLTENLVYKDGLTPISTATSVKMDWLKIAEKNQLFTTNLIYNAYNVGNLAKGWKENDIPDELLTPLDSNQNLKWYQNLYIGRANDQLCYGACGTKINLPQSWQLNDNGGGRTILNSYKNTGIAAFTKMSIIRPSHLGAWDSRNELQFYSRYDSTFDQNNPNHMNFTLPVDSHFKLTDSKGKYYPQNHSKIDSIAIIPVFYTDTYILVDPTNREALRDIPFCAFICRETIDPLVAGFKQIPAPMEGEFFGRSPSFNDNKLAKVVTTQKTTKGGTSALPTYLEGTTEVNTRVYQYMPYVMIGADNPTIGFDDVFGRFTISNLHASLNQGNSVFQDNNNTQNLQSAEVVMAANTQESAICGVNSETGAKLEYASIPQDINNNPIISSQSGIAINSIFLYAKDGSVDNSNDLNPSFPLIYKNSLFDKLGFELEQLIPYIGQRQAQFNRGTYNQYLGGQQNFSDKYNTMVKPFTTNAYISGAIQLSMVKNSKGWQMNNLGANAPNIPVFVNAVSDSLVATNLPTKLDYSYLIVYSNIVQNPQFFGGASGQQKIPAVAYVSRNYSTGDFFFGQPTSWAYTVDKPYIITEFDTNITLPNGLPAPIEDNSSIIYRITRAKTLPPPLSAFEPPPKKK